MLSKRIFLCAAVLAPFLVAAAEPSRVSVSLATKEDGRALTLSKVSVRMGAPTRIGGDQKYTTSEAYADANGNVMTTKTPIDEGLVVVVTPLAVLDDRVVAAVTLQEHKILGVETLRIQNHSVDLPRTQLNAVTLGSVTLRFGESLDLPLDRLGTNARYTATLLANHE